MVSCGLIIPQYLVPSARAYAPKAKSAIVRNALDHRKHTRVCILSMLPRRLPVRWPLTSRSHGVLERSDVGSKGDCQGAHAPEVEST